MSTKWDSGQYRVWLDLAGDSDLHPSLERMCNKQIAYAQDVFRALRLPPFGAETQNALCRWQTTVMTKQHQYPDRNLLTWVFKETWSEQDRIIPAYLQRNVQGVTVVGKCRRNQLISRLEHTDPTFALCFDWVGLSRVQQRKIDYCLITEIIDGYVDCNLRNVRGRVSVNAHFVICADFLPDVRALSLWKWYIYSIPEDISADADATKLTTVELQDLERKQAVNRPGGKTKLQ